MALDITSWSFDQPVYNSGATITLTINYTSTDVSVADVTSVVTVTVTDADSNVSQTSDSSGNFPNLEVAGASTVEATTVGVSDNRSPVGVWTEVSNVLSGTAAPFTGVAVFTSVA
jgi:hypothetical protein